MALDYVSDSLEILRDFCIMCYGMGNYYNLYSNLRYDCYCFKFLTQKSAVFTSDGFRFVSVGLSSWAHANRAESNQNQTKSLMS